MQNAPGLAKVKLSATPIIYTSLMHNDDDDDGGDDGCVVC